MLEKLQSALNVLVAQRTEIVAAGWSLQHCWLVQVKPGGTARTQSKYWQVRSRQPLFDGKTLKHLKPAEVEDYRAAIARGRQLAQIDRQINKLQQQLAQHSLPPDSKVSGVADVASKIPLATAQPPREQLQQSVKLTNAAVEKQVIEDLLAESQKLSAQVIESSRLGKVLLTTLVEQERQVKEMLAATQELRALLRQSGAVNGLLRAQSVKQRQRSQEEDH